MNVPKGGGFGGGGAVRAGRTRRFARSVLQGLRRRFGGGGGQEQTPGEIAREAARAAARRFGRRR